MYPEERAYHRLVEESEKRRSRVKRMGVQNRIRSSVAYNQYQAQVEQQRAKKKPFKYKIPKAASLDLRQYPLLVKLDFAALFLGAIGLFIPYWCVVSADGTTIASFGLWSYCDYSVNYCVSVHDNIIPGKEVQVWYSMCQWNFFIGMAMNFMTLLILTSNIRCEEVVMSGTVYMAAECFSAIAALEKFVSVYTFVTYIDEAEFLFIWGSTVEYHLAFYCATLSIFFDVITAVILFLEEEIGPPPIRQQKKEPYLIQEHDDNKGVYHHSDTYNGIYDGNNSSAMSSQDTWNPEDKQTRSAICDQNQINGAANKTLRNAKTGFHTDSYQPEFSFGSNVHRKDVIWSDFTPLQDYDTYFGSADAELHTNNGVYNGDFNTIPEEIEQDCKELSRQSKNYDYHKKD